MNFGPEISHNVLRNNDALEARITRKARASKLRSLRIFSLLLSRVIVLYIYICIYINTIIRVDKFDNRHDFRFHIFYFSISVVKDYGAVDCLRREIEILR